MFCALSGEIPEEPVVSVKSGHIFEKHLIEKQLRANQGRCPITDQPLELSDLIPVKVNKVVKPRPTGATSIPTLLQTFQNEWDAVMLETYTLKKQLDAVRQELAHALYQHDAACRVIAKLVKERDEARNALANYKPESVPAKKEKASSEAMQVDASSAQLPKELKDKWVEKSQQLGTERRNRKISETLASEDDVKEYQVLSSHNYHKASSPGVWSVDVHPARQSIIATGGADSNIIVFNTSTKKIVSTISDHKNAVRKVVFSEAQPNVLLSASEDGTAKAFRAKNDELTTWETTYTMQHAAAVVGVAFHPTGDHAFAASVDGVLSLHDLSRGAQVGQYALPAEPTSLEVHPDGLILGVGASDSTCKIWDIKSVKIVAVMEGHKGPVAHLAFSENGFYMATIASDSVKLWDLRKLKSFYTIDLPTSFQPQHLSFDYSGSYLAACGSDIRVFHSGAKFTPVHHFTAHSDTVTSLKWGSDAQTFVSASKDRTVKVWGAK